MSLAPLLLALALAQGVAPSTPGSEITVRAGTQTQTEDGWFLLDDYVVIEYSGGRIQADHVEYNDKTQEVLAEGNVVFESGPTVVTGTQMEFNLADGVGIIHAASGWTEQDVQFHAATIEKIGEDKYKLVDGALTACNQALPIWQVNWSSAIINVGETARMWNPVIKFKRFPSAYLPFVVFPIKDERSTGFLVPQVASSSRRGVSAKVGFFWAISRNQDAFVEIDHSDEEFSIAPEYRYVLNDRAHGEFRGQWTTIDRGDGNRREEIEARFRHSQDFLNGFRWRANLRYTSNIDFSRETSTNPNSAVIRNIRSDTFLTKSWGSYNFRIVAEDIRWLDDDRDQRRLPEIELSQNSKQIGSSRVYWGFRANLARFTKEGSYRAPDSGLSFEASPTWERAFFRSDFRVPLSQLPWLDAVVRASIEDAFYTKKLSRDDPEILDQSLNREGAEFALELTGPRIERFYGLHRDPGKNKYQQLMEARMNWRYAPDVDGADEALPWDSLDRRSFPVNPRDPTRDIDRNQLDLGFTTRLMRKRIPLSGEDEESSHEVLSWNLSTSYQVNTFREVSVNGRSERTRFSTVRSELRYRPRERLNFSFRNNYDVVADDLVSSDLTSNLRWGPATLRRWPWSDKDRRSGCERHYCLDLILGARRDITLSDTSKSMNLRGSILTRGERVGFDFDLRRDLLNHQSQTSELVFKYRNQCLGARISYFWNRNGEREVLFTISLRHVGDFLDFRSSQNQ